MWNPTVLLGLTLLVLAKSCQGQNYVLEIYAVVDDSAVQNKVREINTAETYSVKYQKAVADIRKDCDYMITQLNILLSSMSSSGLTLEIRVKRTDILSSNIINTFLAGTRNVVDSVVARNSFQNWLNLQNAYNTIQYDFAVHWTGFDLYGSSGLSENSFTNLASICTSTAVSVIEFAPTYRDIIGTAHALGFGLGASNDGYALTNIMAVLNTPSDANRWTYSGCTASSIKEFLKKPQTSCLLQTSAASTKPSVTYATYSGSILNPDVICQRSLNDSRSYMCKSLPSIYNNLPPRGNAVCSQIYCRIPNTMSCTPAFTSDGMVCDNQKRCTAGQCSSYQTPATDTNCVWGDQKTLEFPSVPFYGSCQSYINTYGAVSCYSSPINESCCSTCKLYNTGRVGCEYGDKSLDCVKYTKAAVCPAYKNSLCCGYCYNYFGKRSITDAQIPPLNATFNNPAKSIDSIKPYSEQVNQIRYR